MNARLDPSTVAARVRVRSAVPHGNGAADAVRRTPRSHGPRERLITCCYAAVSVVLIASPLFSASVTGVRSQMSAIRAR